MHYGSVRIQSAELTALYKPTFCLAAIDWSSVHSSHSSLISLVHAVRSLKRCFLFCLPFSHHQQVSLSVHLHLSLRKGTIIAWPLKSWKYLDAIRFWTTRSWGLALGLAAGVSSLNVLLPAFLLSMSYRHRSVDRSAVLGLRKARLVRAAAPDPPGLGPLPRPPFLHSALPARCPRPPVAEDPLNGDGGALLP